MALESYFGNLKNGYKRLQPGAMLHVDQLMKERRGNADLHSQWFYLADGEIYYLDGAANPTLAMTREAHNPILLHIDYAFTQLTKKGNYRPHQAEVQKALLAPDTVLVDLLHLRLSGDDEGWRFLAIGTAPEEYNHLNDEERKLAERVYGQGDDFAKNMEMLKNADISETMIHLLNPEYVRKHAAAGAVARASTLSSFICGSQFNASECEIGFPLRVRGVLRKNK